MIVGAMIGGLLFGAMNLAYDVATNTRYPMNPMGLLVFTTTGGLIGHFVG